VRAYIEAKWWNVEIDDNCWFDGRAHFKRHPGSRITIGAGCRFNSSPASNAAGMNHPCIISTLKESAEIEIGSGCGFSGTAIVCATKIVLGENVRCGANTLIIDTDGHADDPRATADAPIVIEKGVWLGLNVTVLKGVTIGEGTLVGANSLVTKSLPAGVIAVGNPARVLRKIDVSDIQ